MDKKFNFKESVLFFGLGNPGKEYAKTFHNAGSQFILFLGKKLIPSCRWKKHPSGLFRYTREGGHIFVLPLVFMNESGRMVSKAISFFKIPTKKIVVVHDDSDIPIGTYKIDTNKGAAGHKGILSVSATLDTQVFWRIRIGIRSPEEEKRRKASAFVLSRETPKEEEALVDTFETILEKEMSL